MDTADYADLSMALDLATSACAAAGLPTPDQDKDLVELGRALRAGQLNNDVAAAACEALRLRQMVTMRNLGLAYRLARIVAERERLHALEDLRQFAAMELTKAIARFRPVRSTGRGYLSFVVFHAVQRWARRHRPHEVQFSDTVADYVYGGVISRSRCRDRQ